MVRPYRYEYASGIGFGVQGIAGRRVYQRTVSRFGVFIIGDFLLKSQSLPSRYEMMRARGINDKIYDTLEDRYDPNT